MAIIRNNDEAVSPVIGVILMVAVTVILAAVIAAFVFGLTGNLQSTKNIAVTAQKPNTSAIQIVYDGGQSSALVVNLSVSINGAPGLTMGQGTVGSQTGPMNVGCSTIIYGGSNAYASRTHVLVTATFTDGTQQVVLDTYV
jgi:flagellin-like protein